MIPGYVSSVDGGAERYVGTAELLRAYRVPAQQCLYYSAALQRRSQPAAIRRLIDALPRLTPQRTPEAYERARRQLGIR